MVMNKKLPPPPLTDPGELASYAEEHLVYEVRMFFAAASGLVADEKRRRSADATTTSTPSLQLSARVEPWFARMARIEAVVLHFRNLVAFLFPDKHAVWRNDVSAHHFIRGPDPFQTWRGVRGPLSAPLDAARTRASRELAHLTTERHAGVPPAKSWPAAQLASDVAALLDAFLGAAARDRVGSAAEVISSELMNWRVEGADEGSVGQPRSVADASGEHV
jgi:hypothetical protein